VWADRRRETAGGTLATHRAGRGEGPTLVLLHGVGLRLEAWGGLIDRLSSEHPILAIDLPGHGHSPRLDRSRLNGAAPRLADFTDAVAEAIRLSVDGPAVVAGHSFGAMIALDLAIRHAGLVAAVAAMNAIFRRTDTARMAVQARANMLGAGDAVDATAPLSRWFGDPPADPAAADACRSWLGRADRAGYADAYRVFAEEDGPPDAGLAALDRPALFLTGANDPNSTPAMSRAMADRAPRGRAVILDNAAHMAPMTHVEEIGEALYVAFRGLMDGAGARRPEG
jgi:pimeloyl-ACP methyl ester carboxylesterase